MTAPETALQAAILQRLREDRILEHLLAGRVYDEPPAQPLYPYVAIGRAETRPWGGVDGEGVEHALTLTCVSRFGGAEEAKAVVAAMRAALHEAELTLTDHKLINMRASFADVFRAMDWRSTYGVLRVRAVTEPLAEEAARPALLDAAKTALTALEAARERLEKMGGPAADLRIAETSLASAIRESGALT